MRAKSLQGTEVGAATAKAAEVPPLRFQASAEDHHMGILWLLEQLQDADRDLRLTQIDQYLITLLGVAS